MAAVRAVGCCFAVDSPVLCPPGMAGAVIRPECFARAKRPEDPPGCRATFPGTGRESSPHRFGRRSRATLGCRCGSNPPLGSRGSEVARARASQANDAAAVMKSAGSLRSVHGIPRPGDLKNAVHAGPGRGSSSRAANHAAKVVARWPAAGSFCNGNPFRGVVGGIPSVPARTFLCDQGRGGPGAVTLGSQERPRNFPSSRLQATARREACMIKGERREIARLAEGGGTPRSSELLGAADRRSGSRIAQDFAAIWLPSTGAATWSGATRTQLPACVIRPPHGRRLRRQKACLSGARGAPRCSTARMKLPMGEPGRLQPAGRACHRFSTASPLRLSALTITAN